jgi:HAD superfamily hydrolase (TIGR01509 family)
MPYPLEALIFDFDGLILETEQPEYQSWCEIYEAYDCQLLAETWTQLIGLPWDAISFNPYQYLEAQLGQPVDRPAIRVRRRQRYQELVEAQVLLPGVEAWIREAQQLGLKLGVASNSARLWVMEHLERLQVASAFACVSGREDVERGKPDPAIYLTTLHRLGVRAEAAIALEDSPTGVVAAKAAGLFCVAVPSQLTKEFAFPDADLLLHALTDISLGTLLASRDSQR